MRDKFGEYLGSTWAVKLDVNIFDLDLASVNLNIELLKNVKVF